MSECVVTCCSLRGFLHRRSRSLTVRSFLNTELYAKSAALGSYASHHAAFGSTWRMNTAKYSDYIIMHLASHDHSAGENEVGKVSLKIKYRLCGVSYQNKCTYWVCRCPSFELSSSGNLTLEQKVDWKFSTANISFIVIARKCSQLWMCVISTEITLCAAVRCPLDDNLYHLQTSVSGCSVFTPNVWRQALTSVWSPASIRTPYVAHFRVKSCTGRLHT